MQVPRRHWLRHVAVLVTIWSSVLVLPRGVPRVSSATLKQAVKSYKHDFSDLIRGQDRRLQRLYRQRRHVGRIKEFRQSGAQDPWNLTIGGRCREQEFAYFTKCVTDEVRIVKQCLASICSLLATTDPPCVIAFVSRFVYGLGEATFRRNGVLPVIAPEWSDLPDSHPYKDLTGSTGNGTFNRLYTFSKFEAARLTEFDRVAAFDADIIFMRNASGLQEVDAWAASQVPKGKNFSNYINNGMMVLRPSHDMYSDLVSIWRSGNFSLFYSDEEATEQDVYTELCWVRRKCGPFTDLDPCVFNHGAWIPNTFWRDCPHEGAVLRHNFKISREPILAQRLQRVMEIGKCRPRAGANPALNSCFTEAAHLVDEFGVPYNAERCCFNGRAYMGSELGGDPVCWADGVTFERCCLGTNEAEEVQHDLLRYGDSWYGLTSVPDVPPEGWLGSQCQRSYVQNRFTLASVSPWKARITSQDFESWVMPELVNNYALKCSALDARMVVFEFNWKSYTTRNQDYPAIAGTYWDRLTYYMDKFKTNTMAVCVPDTCCALQPKGVESAMVGMYTVLWHYLIAFLLDMAHEDFLLMPAPEPQDFSEIFAMDVSSWDIAHLCERRSELD